MYIAIFDIYLFISSTNFNAQFSLFINNMFFYIIILDMFRALTYSSSGGKIVFTQHLVSSLSVKVCTVHWLRADCSPLSTSVHVSSINMPIFRRKNCIHTASGIFAVCSPLSTSVLCRLLQRAKIPDAV